MSCIRPCFFHFKFLSLHEIVGPSLSFEIDMSFHNKHIFIEMTCAGNFLFTLTSELFKLESWE